MHCPQANSKGGAVQVASHVCIIAENSLCQALYIIYTHNAQVCCNITTMVTVYALPTFAVMVRLLCIDRAAAFTTLPRGTNEFES